jgi:hypothetical protein
MESDPSSRAIEFPVVYNGVQVIATALAHSDQVTITLGDPEQMLEIELHVWDQLVPRVTVAAHSHSPPK